MTIRWNIYSTWHRLGADEEVINIERIILILAIVLQEEFFDGQTEIRINFYLLAVLILLTNKPAPIFPFSNHDFSQICGQFKFAVHIRDWALEKAVQLTAQIWFRLETDVTEPSIDLSRT